MYPLIRLASVFLTSPRRLPLAPDDTGMLKLIVWPWDCDIFVEMNNGRHLTLYDLGRFDYGARCGLLPLLKKEGWGLVVAGSTVRYRKRLLPFQRYTMHTRLIGRDDRWFYFVQKMTRGGDTCSAALIRTAVTRKGRILPTQDVSEALGHPDWRPAMPDWVDAWITADDSRPWPPEE